MVNKNKQKLVADVVAPPEMDGFSPVIVIDSSAAGATSALSVNSTTRLPSVSYARRKRSVVFSKKQKFLVFTSKEEPEFNEGENEDSKFGRMIGEEPRLTLAKIKARRLDPYVNVLDIENLFYENEGNLPDIEVIPLDSANPSREVRPVQRQAHSSVDVDELIFLRPVLKKGVKFESSAKPNALETREPSLSVRKPVDEKREFSGDAKAKLEVVEDIELKKSVDRITKPEHNGVNEYGDKNQELSGRAKAKVVDDVKVKMIANGNTVKTEKMPLRKPESIGKKQELSSVAKDQKFAEVKQSNLTLFKKPEVVQTQPRHEKKKLQHKIPEVQVNGNAEQSGSRGTSESSGMNSVTKDEIDRLWSALSNFLTKQAKMDRDKLESSNTPNVLETLKSSLSVRKPVDEKRELSGDAKTDKITDKCDIMLLRKPERSGVNEYSYKNSELSGGAKAKVVDDVKVKMNANGNIVKTDKMPLRKPESIGEKQELSSVAKDPVLPMKSKMVKEEAEVKQSNLTLLKKPEAVQTQPRLERKNLQYRIPEVPVSDDVEQSGSRVTSESSGMKSATEDEMDRKMSSIRNLLTTKPAKKDRESDMDLKQGELEHSDAGSTEEETVPREQSTTISANLYSNMSVETASQGKPERFDQPVRETSKSARADTDFAYPTESYGSHVGSRLENSSVESPLEDLEDTYWTRAEKLLETKTLEEMELIGLGSKGFVVSFGPLLGFLPDKNLTAGSKFVSFKKWLRSNGLDPSMYQGNLLDIQSHGITDTNPSPEIDQKIEGGISPDMQFEDLLKIYKQEKNKFLSSFVGQTLKMCVKLADRKSQKLIFSPKPKISDDLAKKKNLMANLRIGDIVTCRITNVSSFCVFVEIEGVRALILQTEVPLDATLDCSYFKIGQMLEARVHQLNLKPKQIFLSLKGLSQPDPLSHTLESAIGDDKDNPSDGRAHADTEVSFKTSEVP